MLYHAYQLQTDWIGPLQRAAEYGAALLNHPPFGTLQTPATRSLAAAWEVFSRLRLTHQRPSFGRHCFVLHLFPIAIRLNY